MEYYRLRLDDMSRLGVYEVDNPHYKKAAPMQLYLLTQVEELAARKWGGAEPYTVALATFSQATLEAFLEDVERLKRLTDDEFELLVAELLAARGYGVQRTGDTRKKDGGIDIVAWPERGSLFPFLMAVQVKHHRTARKTHVSAIRDLHGVITSHNSCFQLAP